MAETGSEDLVLPYVYIVLRHDPTIAAKRRSDDILVDAHYEAAEQDQLFQIHYERDRTRAKIRAHNGLFAAPGENDLVIFVPVEPHNAYAWVIGDQRYIATNEGKVWTFSIVNNPIFLVDQSLAGDDVQLVRFVRP